MANISFSWDSTQNKRKRFLARIINNELDSNVPREFLKDFKKVDSKKLHKDCFITDDGGLANFCWLPDSDKLEVIVVNHMRSITKRWIVDFDEITESLDNVKIIFATDMSHVVILRQKRNFFNPDLMTGIQVHLMKLTMHKCHPENKLYQVREISRLFVPSKKQILYYGYDASISSRGVLTIGSLLANGTGSMMLQHLKLTPENNSGVFIQQLDCSHTIRADRYNMLNLGCYSSSGDILIIQQKSGIINDDCFLVNLSCLSENVTKFHGLHLFLVRHDSSEYLIYNDSSFINDNMVRENLIKVDVVTREKNGTLLFRNILTLNEGILHNMVLHHAECFDISNIFAVTNDHYGGYFVIDVFAKRLVHIIETSFMKEHNIFYNFHQMNWRYGELFLLCSSYQRYNLKCIPLDQSFPSLFELAREKVFETYNIKELQDMNLSDNLKTLLYLPNDQEPIKHHKLITLPSNSTLV